MKDWELRFELNEDGTWDCVIGLETRAIKDCGKTIEKALQNTMLQLSPIGLDSFMERVNKTEFSVHYPCDHCTERGSIYCCYNCRNIHLF